MQSSKGQKIAEKITRCLNPESQVKKPDLSAKEIEEQIKHVIASRLELSIAQVDSEQDFTMMGLDSLMVIELRNCLEERFDFYPDDDEFFEFENIRELARAVYQHLLASGSESESDSKFKDESNDSSEWEEGAL